MGREGMGSCLKRRSLYLHTFICTINLINLKIWPYKICEFKNSKIQILCNAVLRIFFFIIGMTSRSLLMLNHKEKVSRSYDLLFYVYNITICILSPLSKRRHVRSSPSVEWDLVGNQMTQSDDITENWWSCINTQVFCTLLWIEPMIVWVVVNLVTQP